MHIGFLTPEYPHPKLGASGGLGTSIKNLAEALSVENVKVTVFVYGQKQDEIFSENGIIFHRIKQRRTPFLTWFTYRKYLQNYLNRVAKTEKIDLIEAPDWTGITAFMNLLVPLVIRFHGSDAYFCHLEGRKQKRKNFWFEKQAVQSAQAFIAPTTFAGNLSKEIFGLKNKTVQTIHYGLKLPDFSNAHPNDFEMGTLLYIGTIIRKKGVLELPEIFKKVVSVFPNSQLILIGSDSPDIQTQSSSTWKLVEEKLDADMRSKVKYLGKIPYDEVQNHIRKAHVCLFPTFAETLGMVTIESMALQKPVVNSNIGWANELIEDGISGFLAHPKDHDLYADRIIALLDNPELCREMGENARQRVEEKFDIQKVVQENIRFYQSFLNQSI
ncbi:MAG: glycosyltransferase family 1 protein [Bacteroidetes bacterium HGW-Bacteroidetes-13]|nr:MAG: glycosyltransferase family 1 protein [Bacteroidetes bacterium HGW-Bacteroidetes-13]